MSHLFNKVLVWTDIHFGKSNNSKDHNQNCINFVQWSIEEAKKFGAETFICMGDWHDSRRSLNISTMKFTLDALELLNNNFKQCYILTGNHDLFFRDKRDLNSIEFAKKFNNIKLINEIYTEENCAFVPWLVGNEYKEVPKIKCKYMFGHFELEKFLVNSMVEMVETELKAEHFKNQEYVFSGHFHKRQKKKNIWYMGNCFPHNFSDAWDEERGIMLLEWDKEPIFKSWPDQPVFKTFKLSQLINSPDTFLNKNVHAKVITDVDITYEEMTYLKEEFTQKYNVRELILVPLQNDDDNFEFDEKTEFQSVDQIVIEGIQSMKNIENSNINYKLLIEIYNSIDIHNE